MASGQIMSDLVFYCLSVNLVGCWPVGRPARPIPKAGHLPFIEAGSVFIKASGVLVSRAAGGPDRRAED